MNMKKIIFTILLFVLALTSFAQKDNLYVNGKKWVTALFMFNNDNSAEVYIPVLNTYVISGDSVIGDNRYKKLICYHWEWIDELQMGMCDYNGTDFLRYADGRYLQYVGPNSHTLEEGYSGNDIILFDENLKAGDAWLRDFNRKIGCIADTMFDSSADKVRKYWKLQPRNNSYWLYNIVDNVVWIDGIGTLNEPVSKYVNTEDCMCSHLLLYCINPDGDTIYRNQKYIDLFESYFKTDIRKISASEISFTQQGSECIVTLPADVAAWEAALSNSVGVTVARRSGEGSEIILPATSKGTHILVVKAGGRVMKKKVFIK